jgi:2'-5' RNA ligase
MIHRIFIAIKIPGKMQDQLLGICHGFPELPVRWTRKENLHFTLLFIGNASDQEAAEICKATKKVASLHPRFSIEISGIDYGPEGKIPPRMVWAKAAAGNDFSEMRKDLEKEISNLGMHLASEKKGPMLHATLGRVRAWQWARIEPEERPEIKQDLSLSFIASSIEVMESKLKPKGPDYTVLEEAPLEQ